MDQIPYKQDSYESKEQINHSGSSSDHIRSIYDRIFKKLFSLSSKAVVNMINGLFSTNYSPDSVVTYPGTEHIKNNLSEVLADIFITINGIHTYHLEAQMTEDRSIIFRIFEYGFLYADRCRQNDTLYFPEPKILYLYSEKQIPEYQMLHLHFPNQGIVDYKIATFNFINTTTEELNKRKLVLLIPFQLLKLRRLLEQNRSEKNLEQLKRLLLHDILKPIEDNYKAGNIELADAEHLKELTHRLYTHLYAHYREMSNGGVNSMVDDIMVLDSERIIAQLTRQVTEEVTSKITQEVTDRVTQEVTDKITQEVTDKVTQEVTDKVTQEVTDKVTQEVTDKVTQEVTDKVTQEIMTEATQEIQRIKTQNKETIRLLCAGESPEIISEQLKIDLAEVIEIASLLKG